MLGYVCGVRLSLFVFVERLGEHFGTVIAVDERLIYKQIQFTQERILVNGQCNLVITLGVYV